MKTKKKTKQIKLNMYEIRKDEREGTNFYLHIYTWIKKNKKKLQNK
jgi:hypothetical protein